MSETKYKVGEKFLFRDSKGLFTITSIKDTSYILNELDSGCQKYTTEAGIDEYGTKVERGLIPKYKVKDVFRFRHKRHFNEEDDPIQEWKITKIIDVGQSDLIYELHSNDPGVFFISITESKLQTILHDLTVVSSKFELEDKLVDKYSEPYPIVIEVSSIHSSKNKQGVREYVYHCAYSTKEEPSRQFKEYKEYSIIDFPVVSKETPIGPYEVKETK